MGLSSETVATLRQLSASAGSDRDLVAGLQRLLGHARDAVPSCVAVSLTVSRQGLPLTLTAYAAASGRDQVLSSLSVRLPAHTAAETASRALTLYSVVALAFSQLAADLLALLDLDPRHAIIDGHLDLPTESSAARGLRSGLGDLSAIDQALGILIDRGFSPADGRLELERLAAGSGSSLATAAGLVVDAVKRRPR